MQQVNVKINTCNKPNTSHATKVRCVSCNNTMCQVWTLQWLGRRSLFGLMSLIFFLEEVLDFGIKDHRTKQIISLLCRMVTVPEYIA